MMTKYYLASLLLLIIGITACQKEDNASIFNDDEYYVSFDLNGARVEMKTENPSTGTSLNPIRSSVSSSVSQPNDPYSRLSIEFAHDKDELTEADLLKMVGKRIQVGICGHPTCGVRAELSGALSSSFRFNSRSIVDNEDPIYEIRLNSVTYHDMLDRGGTYPLVKRFVVEGTFRLMLEDSDTDPSQMPKKYRATNGVFRLLLCENR